MTGFDIVLVSLDLTKTPAGRVHRVTSAAHDVEYNGYVYTAVGDALAIEEVDESNDLTTIGMGISLSGLDPAYREEIDQGGLRHAPIEVLIAHLPENTNIVPSGTAIIYHRGTCDTPNTVIDYESNTMTIDIQTESIFGILSKVPDLCRTSMSTHESRHAGDKFFTYVASTSQTEVWKS